MYKTVFFFISLFISLPLVFTGIEKFTGGAFLFPLSGSFPETEKPLLQWEHIKSGKFQKQVNHLFDASFGLRSIYVRFRNQMQFTLWNRANANKVVIGKSGTLFESDHIDAYSGLDLLEEDQIELYAKELRSIQDALQKKGKVFLVVLAPGKASIYPDRIPKHYKHPIRPNSNHLLFHRALEKEGVHTYDTIVHLRYMISPLDAGSTSFMLRDPSQRESAAKDIFSDIRNALLLPANIKDKIQLNKPNETRLRLYPEYGTHWSVYSAYYIMDEIKNIIEAESQTPLPVYKWDKQNAQKLPRFTDADIHDSLNLMWSLPWGEYVYPVLSRDTKSSESAFTILSVGDSFYQTFFATDIPFLIYSKKSDFWYYGKMIFSADNSPAKKSEEVNFADEIAKSDAVILLVSEVNFKWFGYGWIGKAKDKLLQN